MLLKYVASFGRKPSTSRKSAVPKPPRRSLPLELEPLEDRCQPASLLWVGGAGAFVSNANSWLTITAPAGVHQAPTASDTLVFNPSMAVAGTNGANTSPDAGLPLDFRGLSRA